MPEANNNNKPFLIILFTFLVLLMVSVIVPKNVWLRYQRTPVNIMADLEPQKQEQHHSTYRKKKNARKQKTLVQDTIRANEAVTSLIREDIAIEVADSAANEGMFTFLEALHKQEKTQKRKVRIGYFGDSMIEGDLITQTIRNILQNRFGGEGVGYIPVTSVVAHFRQTVRATASENWSDVGYTNNKQKQIIGFSGHTFFPGENATVAIKPGGGKHLSALYKFSILYGKTETPLVLQYNNNPVALEGAAQFNKHTLESSEALKKATLSFKQSSVPVYGFSSESEYGVILDNFSYRGTSGTELLRLNSKMLKQIDSLHHYDLIVLHYGPNLLYNDSITDFSYYRKQMEKSLKHLKKAFPHTSFLIVSTADKAFKINGEYQTGHGVEPLLKAQQQLAQKFNCAFYNLYEAMGGYNSMKTWAEKKPIMAGNDYTHFNQSGSAKIGRLIGNAILNEYEQKYSAD